jgi:hypothetical protein
MNTFLLIDLALIGAGFAVPPLSDYNRPSWAYPLYDEDSHKVTPLLIDLQEIVSSGEISQLMQIWNARAPQLHASIIHSDFSLAQLAIHLQLFIYILTVNGEIFTFRFADCAVLNFLPDHLTVNQWQTMTKPISRWLIHGRDGKLKNLPLSKNPLEMAEIPMLLEEIQVSSLREALSADRLIFHLRRIRPTQMDNYNEMELHTLVTEACSMWRTSGQTDQLLLLDFLLGAIDTDGRILRMTGMTQILNQASVETIRSELNKAIIRNSFAK